MPAPHPTTYTIAQYSMEEERAAFALKAMQMRLHRRAAMSVDMLPYVLPIKVHIPEEYFNLRVQALQSVTVIEADPTSLHPSEQDALDANPLLSDLCLILTSQKNPSVNYLYVIKAVAIALRDEYQHFSKWHLEIQSRISLNDDMEEDECECELDDTRLGVVFPVPEQRDFIIRSVLVENSLLEPAERQVMLDHRARVIVALVLTGREYPDLPIGLLYKAVARAFKPANKKSANKKPVKSLLPSRAS